MILVGYRHECAPPGVNRVSYDALADPLAWAACAPGKKRSPAPRLVLVNPSAQCVGLPGGDANHSVCFRDRAWLRTVCECVKLHTHSNTDVNCLLWEIHCRLSMTDAVHMPPSHSGLRVGHPPLTWCYRPHCRFRSHRGCHPRNPAPSGPVSAEHGPAARGRVAGRSGAAAPSPAPCAPPVPHPARFPTPPKKVARG